MEPETKGEDVVGPNKMDAGDETALDEFGALNDAGAGMGTSLGPDRLDGGGCDCARLEIFPPFRPTM